MKTTLLFLLFSTSAFALQPSEGCKIKLINNAVEYSVCDNGIFAFDLVKKTSVKADPKKVLETITSLLVPDDYDKDERPPLSKDLRVPNDSCSIGYIHESLKYYYCDQGIFRVDEDGKFSRQAGYMWNQTLIYNVRVHIADKLSSYITEIGGPPEEAREFFINQDRHKDLSDESRQSSGTENAKEISTK